MQGGRELLGLGRAIIHMVIKFVTKTLIASRDRLIYPINDRLAKRISMSGFAVISTITIALRL